ncbi:DNA polymerase delta subunit 2 [Dermatophagoides pteronyssinus]|uniref:DNA polymerase delta subunit 2 n=1 Tax=Dermatophagoides pteronyssinus TaxID=6956 RepID=A0ABQ8JE94_DERPT|nr:DNA polymerase delta subunit 2 [Dermatophagoides pteronyssinus]
MTKTSITLPERDVIYKNDPFLIKKYDCNLQYFPYYRARLNQMKRPLILSAKYRWPGVAIYTLSDLADSKAEADKFSQDSNDELLEQDCRHGTLFGKDVVVCGMLLKRMSKQPNILKELDDERKLIEPLEESCKNYCSPNDTLFLQDGDESIELKGDDLPINQLCTGVCLVAKGQLNPNGSGFIVEDYCFALIQNSVDRPLTHKDYYMLIISGLNLNSNTFLNDQKLSQSLNLLFDLVTGHSDSIMDKTIVNLILAGNSIDLNGGSKSEDLLSQSEIDSNDAVKMLDRFLANVGKYMFVDIMPGSLDISTGLYPQQPIHPCLFPKAFRLSTIRSVTNPHRAQYFGVDFLGTSGENINSICSCTSWNESIEIMRNLLQWGHLAPACPDLLHSYPFSQHDPLVIDQYPDVLFAGNQPEFSCATFDVPKYEQAADCEAKTKTIRLISVPSFREKHIGVIVNIRTLECEMLAFN